MFFIASKILVWLIFPLSLGILLLVLAYAATLLRRRSLFHFLFLTGILVVYLCSIRPGSDFLLKPLERKYLSTRSSHLKADAIVVLAGDLRKKVFPREDIEVDGSRVLKAVRLFKEKAAPIIIMTGGSGSLFRQDYKEAVFMKELASELGVPPDKILVETESRNTRENIVYTKQILQKIKAKKVVLVTSALHLPRAYALSTKAGIDAVPVAAEFYATDEAYNPFNFVPSPGDLLYSSAAIKEYVGILAYWLMGWI